MRCSLFYASDTRSIRRLWRGLSSQPDGTDSRQRLGSFLESNYGRLGARYGVLVAVASGISPENMARLEDHIELAKASLTDFASLAELPSIPLPHRHRRTG